MTTRYGRETQCTGEVRYLSRRAARVARRAFSRAAGDHLRVYRCAWCDTYHLGHVRAHALADDDLLELAERDPAAAERRRIALVFGEHGGPEVTDG